MRLPTSISNFLCLLARHRRNVEQSLLLSIEGAAILEFAISLPLLVVFIFGIYDFSYAFNQRQKIEQAAQEGAIVAAAQPTSDIDTSNGNPDSLQPVVAAIYTSLAGSGVLSQANQGTCSLTVPPSGTQNPSGTPNGNLTWGYTIPGCPGTLSITINRGWSSGTAPAVVGTQITVTYPYVWRFNSVIGLMIPGANYSPTTFLTEQTTVHNQT